MLYAYGNNTGYRILDPDSAGYPEIPAFDISAYISETGFLTLSGDSVVFTQTEKIYPGSKYILATWYKGILLFSREGKLLNEIRHDSKPDNGTVYQGEAVLQKTAAGFLYMPYPKDTVYLVGNDLSGKPLLAVKKRREEGTLLSYRILFSQHESFIPEITENQLKNEGDGSILMLAGKKEYFRINTEDENITRFTNDTLAKLTFYNRGYCVSQSDPETDVHHLNTGISILK